MDMRGLEWTDEKLAVLTANPKPPMTFNRIEEPMYAMPIIDRDLLNPLDQPTDYEKAQKRKRALGHYIDRCRQTAIARLEGRVGTARTLGSIAEKYKEKFQFTQEEIDGYRREEN